MYFSLRQIHGFVYFTVNFLNRDKTEKPLYILICAVGMQVYLKLKKKNVNFLENFTLFLNYKTKYFPIILIINCLRIHVNERKEPNIFMD